MIIYKTTNLVNGKIYVGKNEKNDDSYYGSGLILKQAIKKYGVENFNKEILCECDNKIELNKMEKYWIKKLNSQDKNIGYNIANGGEGGDTITYAPNYDERCQNCARVGKNNGMYGKKHSKEAIEKMKKARIKYFENEENRINLSKQKIGIKSPEHSRRMIEYYRDKKNRNKTKNAIINYYNNRTKEEKIAHSEKSKQIARELKKDKNKWNSYIENQKKSQKKVWTKDKREEHKKLIKKRIKFVPINFIKKNNINIDNFISLLENNNTKGMLKLKKKFNAKNIQFSIKSILKNFGTIENFKKGVNKWK